DSVQNRVTGAGERDRQVALQSDEVDAVRGGFRTNEPGGTVDVRQRAAVDDQNVGFGRVTHRRAGGGLEEGGEERGAGADHGHSAVGSSSDDQVGTVVERESVFRADQAGRDHASRAGRHRQDVLGG